MFKEIAALIYNETQGNIPLGIHIIKEQAARLEEENAIPYDVAFKNLKREFFRLYYIRRKNEKDSKK